MEIKISLNVKYVSQVPDNNEVAFIKCYEKERSYIQFSNNEQKVISEPVIW